MAFKRVGGSSNSNVETTYYKAKDLAKGQEFIGTYTGSAESKNFVGAMTHFLSKEDGTAVGINGTGKLNYLIGLINKGSLIKIVYLGTEDVDGRQLHNWELFEDAEASASSASTGSDVPF